MSDNLIVFEAPEDGVALLTVNRPDKLNALNARVMGELESAVARAETDDAIRGLIVTGAGEKAFVAGADISELAIGDAARGRKMSLHGQGIFRRLERLGKPSVAAINGYALGGGLELALACTFRLATPTSKLGLPEIKLGILPGYGGTGRLPRLIGASRALELLLTGEPVEAAEAERVGLVNRVVPAADLLGAARALLRKIAERPPLAVAAILQTVWNGLDLGLEPALNLEASAFAALATTEDAREGTRAFLEKRKPVFKGR